MQIEPPDYAVNMTHSADTALAQGGKLRAAGRAAYRERQAGRKRS
jgi:hypothetical protein